MAHSKISTLGSADSKSCGLACRIHRIRKDGSRIRKENVANSKISRYVWTGRLDNAGNSRQGIWRRAVPPHCKTNAKYVKPKEKLPRMISCLFRYWEEGNHEVIKKDIQSYILAIDPSTMYDCTSLFLVIKGQPGMPRGYFQSSHPRPIRYC